MSRLAGLSYGSSIAYPHRTHCKRAWRADLLALVIIFVHPGNFSALPPAPREIALKAEQIGLGDRDEFERTIWY